MRDARFEPGTTASEVGTVPVPICHHISASRGTHLLEYAGYGEGERGGVGHQQELGSLNINTNACQAALRNPMKLAKVQAG